MSDIPAGDGKIVILFLQCSLTCRTPDPGRRKPPAGWPVRSAGAWVAGVGRTWRSYRVGLPYNSWVNLVLKIVER